MNLEEITITEEKGVQLPGGIQLTPEALRTLEDLQLDTTYVAGNNHNQGISYYNNCIQQTINYLIDLDHNITSIDYLINMIEMLEQLRTIQKLIESFRLPESRE